MWRGARWTGAILPAQPGRASAEKTPTGPTTRAGGSKHLVRLSLQSSPFS